MKKITGFWAFGAEPLSTAETVELAIDKINSDLSVCLLPWSHLKTGGRQVIAEICREIQKSSFFIADISGLNHNVLFELGFAISRKKRIWLTVDGNNPSNLAILKTLPLINGIGYVEYINYDDIYREFYKDEPHNSLV